jgi:hypothetical protein
VYVTGGMKERDMSLEDMCENNEADIVSRNSTSGSFLFVCTDVNVCDVYFFLLFLQVQVASPHTSNENFRQVIGNLQRRNRPELKKIAVESSKNYFASARVGMLDFAKWSRGCMYPIRIG